MEPFPALEQEPSPGTHQPNARPVPPGRPGGQEQPDDPSNRTTSTLLRRASSKFLESNPPSGAWLATGEIASRAPTLDEIRTGSFSSCGWIEEGQLERRGNTAHEIQQRKLARSNSFARQISRESAAAPLEALHEDSAATEKPLETSETTPSSAQSAPVYSSLPNAKALDSHTPVPEEEEAPASASSDRGTPAPSPARIGPDETGTYPNGYRFPPKHTWQRSIVIGLKAFGRFTLTPFGFLVTLYCLNIVAWGAMIFFLLLNAAPAMCNPSCDADDSPRKKWIEINAQTLNALFCVTGFGLIPWRFRDFYYLVRWRISKSHDSLRRLAGVHRSWFRLPGSHQLPDDIGPPPIYLPFNSPHGTGNILRPYTQPQLDALAINPAVPLPMSSIPPAPLTGVRATPTKTWWLDAVIWLYVVNTAQQAGLAGLMWGMNRHERPDWAVGFAIALGCVTGAIAGLIGFQQGRRVKATEGVPVEEKDDDPDGLTELARKKTDLGEKSERGVIGKLVRRDSHWYRRH